LDLELSTFNPTWDSTYYLMASFFGNFSRFGSVLVFIFLELICLFLIVQFNQKQRDIWVYSGSLFSGKILEASNQAGNYFYLSSVADSIANENAALLKQITNDKSLPLLIYSDTLEVAIDTAAVDRYELIPAKVINNSINKNRNFFTINKGAVDGIEKHSGIVTPNGVVGIIRQVSENYSVAMSLLNSQMRVSVAIKRTGYFGTMSWFGKNPLVMDLDDIPKHADLIAGDTLITSGYSAIFPPGLQLGILRDFKIEPGSNFYTAKVDLDEDISRLNYIYILKHIEKPEILELETLLENE